MFDRMFEAVASDPDLRWLPVNATVIRVRAMTADERHEPFSG